MTPDEAEEEPNHSPADATPEIAADGLYAEVAKKVLSHREKDC